MIFTTLRVLTSKRPPDRVCHQCSSRCTHIQIIFNEKWTIKTKDDSLCSDSYESSRISPSTLDTSQTFCTRDRVTLITDTMLNQLNVWLFSNTLGQHIHCYTGFSYLDVTILLYLTSHQSASSQSPKQKTKRWKLLRFLRTLAGCCRRNIDSIMLQFKLEMYFWLLS